MIPEYTPAPRIVAYLVSRVEALAGEAASFRRAELDMSRHAGDLETELVKTVTRADDATAALTEAHDSVAMIKDDREHWIRRALVAEKSAHDLEHENQGLRSGVELTLEAFEVIVNAARDRPGALSKVAAMYLGMSLPEARKWVQQTFKTGR